MRLVRKENNSNYFGYAKLPVFTNVSFFSEISLVRTGVTNKPDCFIISRMSFWHSISEDQDLEIKENNKNKL